MTLEIFCSIILGYILLVVKVNKVFESRILDTINNTIPKIGGVLIFVYLILKYVFKLEG